MDLRLIAPPVAGAAIGWFTNYVAIKLLFRPHMPVDVFGIRIQGLIPKRRKDIARSMARAIESELLTSEDLAATLNGIDWKAEVEKTVEEALDHRLGSERLKRLPVVGLVADNLKYHLKYFLVSEVLRQIERKKDSIASKFKQRVDIQGMVVSKIDRLDLSKFESLLNQFIARELKHLEWLGGVMGLLIGMAQSAIQYALG
jgi:uncharacterized membrane protein YheB (UPF0754 family)